MDTATFILLLPLPYRLAITIVLGLWLWGLALHLLRPLPRLIGYPHAQHASQSTYTFASVLTFPVVLSILFYAVIVTEENKASWRFLPNLTLVLTLVAFVPIVHLPGLPLPRQGRVRFMASLRRVAVGGLAGAEEARFGDVLLADALTSYARVISELYIALCLFLPRQHTPADVTQNYGAAWIVPLLAGYPFLIRLRQCLVAHQPANALKYSTAFPPLLLGALLSQPQAAPISHGYLRGWWLLFALINSSYSLYWDLFQDWDLALLSRASPSLSHPPDPTRRATLTPRLYAAVILDTLGRFTWLLRVSVRLDVYEFQERTVFVLEMLEVLRRWMWLLLRAETEEGRKAQRGLGAGGEMMSLDT